MKSKLNWQLFINTPRHQAIEAVKTSIGAHNGSIVHFQLFSDLGLSLSVEIAEKDIPQLFGGLKYLGSISEFDFSVLSPSSEKEWLVFINISFATGTGNMTATQPQVPG